MSQLAWSNVQPGVELIGSTISYPFSLVNVFVGAGLIWLYFNRETYDWHPPFKASLPVAIFFTLSNIYLVVAPFVPPSEGQNIYQSLPYYTHCVVGIGIIAAGGLYWLVWAKILPYFGKYQLVREVQVDTIDGWDRNVFVRRSKDDLSYDE